MTGRPTIEALVACCLVAASLHAAVSEDVLVASGPDQQSAFGVRGDCLTTTERLAVDSAIRAFESRNHARVATEAGPPQYPFFPQAGSVGSDLFFINAVDLDTTSGVRDFDCTAYTYDGHQGHDMSLRSFREQEIGVPLFAAFDGTVVDAHDGEPDHNTAGDPTVRANYVILYHGGSHYTWYWHLKTGSVAVAAFQYIPAGTQLGLTASSGYSTGPHLHLESRFNGKHFEPSAGTCRTGVSFWRNQPRINRETTLRDLSFSDGPYSRFPCAPYDDAPRVGTFAEGIRSVSFRIDLYNLPAGATYTITFLRPDGTSAVNYANTFPTTEFYRSSWWWWQFNINLTPGTWTLVLQSGGTTLAEAPFDVVTASSSIVNRPPRAVSAQFDPPFPAENEVIFCRVATSLITEDPDYDIVRYRYQWRSGDTVLRDVTSAGLSDAIPRGSARRGDIVTCSVTPSDGVADGPTASATVSVGDARRRGVRR